MKNLIGETKMKKNLNAIETIYQQLAATITDKSILEDWNVRACHAINNRTLQFKVSGSCFQGHIRIQYVRKHNLCNLYFGHYGKNKKNRKECKKNWGNLHTEKDVSFSCLIGYIYEYITCPYKSTKTSLSNLNIEEPKKSIAIIWHVDDVKSIRPELSDEQAMEVLERFEKHHDPAGLDWDFIKDICNELYPT